MISVPSTVPSMPLAPSDSSRQIINADPTRKMPTQTQGASAPALPIQSVTAWFNRGSEAANQESVKQ